MSAPSEAASTPFLDRLREDAPLVAAELRPPPTGLDAAADAIVSIGAVRMHGARIYPSANLDRLVNPGRPVPAAATAIHGIDDHTLRGAPEFADIWPQLLQLLDGCVLVGHNIAFDVTHLCRAARAAELTWTPPETLDTLLLAAALEAGPTTDTDPRLDLDNLAARYGIEARGRHTALGDALVTAELYAHLLPLLEDIGVHTLGAALALQDTQHSLVIQQRQLGWHER